MIYNSLSEALSKKNQSKELGAKYFIENNKKIQWILIIYLFLIN